MARKHEKKPASGKKKRSRKGKKESAEAASGREAPPSPDSPVASGEGEKSKKKRSRKAKKKAKKEEGGDAAADRAAAPPSASPDEPADELGHEIGHDVEAHRDEEPTVLDLDADEPPPIDLDDDGEAADLVASLIAEAAAGAPAAEQPAELEPPLIDLDAAVEAELVEPEPPQGDAGRDDPDRATPAPAALLSEAAEAATDARTVQAAEPGQETTAQAIRRLADRGPVSSAEIRDRLLAEALAHAEHKDARYRVPFSDTPTVGRWKALAGLVILLAAGVIALAPPGWATPDPPEPLAAQERVSGVRAALLLQAEQVEAFRVRELRLPESLDEIAGTLPGVRYVRSGTRAYQLIAYLPDGRAIVYDSTSPTPAFQTVGRGWRAQEGAP